MKATLTKIGNSKGLIIPSKILQQCGFDQDVELEVKDNQVIISPARGLRDGWAESLQDTPADEGLLLTDSLVHDWDKEEWEW
jgi:antitoxin MazE